MLNGAQVTSMANSVGNTSIGIAFTTVSKINNWIIDMGATNHIVVDPPLLHSSLKMDPSKLREVFYRLKTQLL